MVRKNPLFWSLLVAAVPLFGWWTYGLFDLDEGFYAAVTAEMNRRGEWITPFFNGHPWFEKPILLYWLAKPSLYLSGNMVGPRLPCVLATLGTYAVVAWFARRRFGVAAAVLSVLALASSLLVVGVGRMMLTDPLLLLALTAAFCTLWESISGDPRWRLLTGLSLGLGVLAKGPIAVILFVPVAAYTWWSERELRPAWRGWWLPSFLVFGFVVSAWYLPAYLVDGHVFVQKFLIEQNVGRFSGGDQAHTLHGIAGLIFYVPVILVGFLPWWLWLPAALKRRTDGRDALRKFLGAWAAAVLLFFTVAGAKLPSYVLPMAPPCAILVGAELARRWSPLTGRRLVLPLAWLFFVACLAEGAFYAYYHGATVAGIVIPGSQAEIHALSDYVRAHAAPTDLVAEYKMGRQQKDLGTGKARVQETAEPSTLLYLNRDVLETDDWRTILTQTGRVWVLTRWNRISRSEESDAGGRLVPVAAPAAQDYFRLYIVEPFVGKPWGPLAPRGLRKARQTQP